MTFADRLLQWFDEFGRHDLPWQHPRSPYRVWLSEIMLQQTQVTTVIPYFDRFLQRFPDLPTLAAAPLDDVLGLWAGLGYYSRARNLHRAAQICVTRHGGDLPDQIESLVALPGIGRSTAAAIVSQAFGRPAPILDGNVKRVLSRYAGVTDPINTRSVEQNLWRLAESILPEHRAADYTQAMMDLGATLCTPRKPACEQCPQAATCEARRLGLQDTIPAKPKKKAVPTREVQVVILRDETGATLLQRRPETGIWGGLYSLPEFDLQADLGEALGTRFGVQVRLLDGVRTLEHRFTHFKLLLTARNAQVTAINDRMREQEDHRFVAPDQINKLGLPKPIQILLGLDSTGNTHGT